MNSKMGMGARGGKDADHGGRAFETTGWMVYGVKPDVWGRANASFSSGVKSTRFENQEKFDGMRYMKDF